MKYCYRVCGTPTKTELIFMGWLVIILHCELEYFNADVFSLKFASISLKNVHLNTTVLNTSISIPFNV